ncbi:MAG: hypothetical protein ACI9MR_001755 [Myxococcota bacterium]|jgi:hypothetical protein
MKMDPKEEATQMAWFDAQATVSFKDKTYGLTLKELEKPHGRAYCWHLKKTRRPGW